MGAREREPRRRDSARTRADLLEAASELFGRHGFERTTLRDIGEKAGVDPALIARYFGSKAQLYIATLEADGARNPDGDSDRSVLDRFIRRTVSLGPSSLVHAAVSRNADPEVRTAAAEIVEARVVSRFVRVAEGAGVSDPRLRGELAAAMLAGVALCRASGMFGELAAADHDEVVELTEALLLRLLNVEV